MEVRVAGEHELEAVGELTVAAYEQFMLGPRDPYRVQVRDAARRAREAELWVAAESERLLGCVTYCPPGSPWRELAGGADEGEFRMLAVHPDARGRGAGQALAAHCEERARAHGAVRMRLSSLAEMSAAHRVYGRLGYVRDPARDWSPLPDVHLLAFAKELS